jgi:hypothetical protein
MEHFYFNNGHNAPVNIVRQVVEYAGRSSKALLYGWWIEYLIAYSNCVIGEKVH